VVVGAAGPERPSATLRRMLDSMRSRGPDGATSWADGHAAIGYLSLVTTPEARAERQPFVDRLTGHVVVMDGRLDNRDDLLGMLDGAVAAADSDVDFVAAAYRRWDVDAFSRLLGDFALAIWNPAARTLTCARDVMGVRPLCYAWSDDGDLLVASEVRALLATGLVPSDINEARALEHLAGQEQHRTETLFRRISRIAAGHVVVFGAGREVRSRAVWSVVPPPAALYY
jgi:asparagine synthase (glutamine-hydrolysing)